ncbi:hypothetical protein [Bradyrhizobium sp. S3.7.6]
MLQYPREGERDFIASIEIAAVFIGLADACCLVRSTRDLEASERELRKMWPSLQIVAAWWVETRADADLLARRLKRKAPSVDGSVFTVQAEIEAEAARAGLKLTSHATVMRRVSEAARRVEAALGAANARGELAWFNRSYREYRARGGRRMSYSAARSCLRRAMVRRLTLVERIEYGPEMLAEVFGEGW